MIDADPSVPSVRQAREEILRRVRPLPPERVPLSEAIGRVLVEPVIARVDVPPWDNAAMDGYALRSGDAGDGALPVVLDLPAGAVSGRDLEAGSAARIMTGAPIPRGADAVVPVEESEGPAGAGVFAAVGEKVRFLRRPAAGAHVRRRGEDVRRGEVAVPAGAVCGGAEIAMAAAVGRGRVTVRSRPRVAILSTGDELVDVDEAGTADRIVDGNAHGVAAQVVEAGGVPVVFPIVRDDPDGTRDAFRAAFGFDAVATIGGVSVGERDHVRAALEAEGVELVFERVAVKPGGPTTFGVGPGGRPVFGLPGNPVSALVSFELFFRPALLGMGGRRRCFRRPIAARLAEAVSKRPGKTWALRGRLGGDEEGPTVALAGPQGSGVLSTLVAADALVILPREAGDLPAGAVVDVVPWKEWGMGESP